MNLLRVSREMFQKLIGKTSLRFDELPIKLHIVVTGVRTGFQLDERTIQPGEAGGFSPLSFNRRLRSFFSIIRQISQNPRFLTQVVFGKEPGTEQFPLVEAVGFSCSVPGLLHYDVYHDDPETIAPLEQLFERHQLWRMCDGGRKFYLYPTTDSATKYWFGKAFFDVSVNSTVSGAVEVSGSWAIASSLQDQGISA